MSTNPIRRTARPARAATTLAGLGVLVAVAVAVAGCGDQLASATRPSGSASQSPVPVDTATGSRATPAPTPSTTASTTASATPRPTQPHFDTPEAAMRYLAAAYNRGDVSAMRSVTNPDARADLQMMHSEAINLRLKSCTKNPVGHWYTCLFSHDYPPKLHMKGHGHAELEVAPADRPGWYLADLLGCG